MRDLCLKCSFYCVKPSNKERQPHQWRSFLAVNTQIPKFSNLALKPSLLRQKVRLLGFSVECSNIIPILDNVIQGF